MRGEGRAAQSGSPSLRVVDRGIRTTSPRTPAYACAWGRSPLTSRAGGGYPASTIDFTSGPSSDDLFSSLVATASTDSQALGHDPARLVLALLEQLIGAPSSPARTSA